MAKCICVMLNRAKYSGKYICNINTAYIYIYIYIIVK